MEKHRWLITGGSVSINGKTTEAKMPEHLGFDNVTGELVLIPPEQVLKNRQARAHLMTIPPCKCKED